MNPEQLSGNNFKYSLDFLKRFNALRYDGKPLSEQKIFDQYNVWIFFQNRIFFGDLKEFSAGQKVQPSTKSSLRISLQNVVLAIFGLAVSFLAVVSGILFKKKFLVYSIDRTNSNVMASDARMDPIYQYLKLSRDAFLECLHTTFDRGYVKRFFRRRRLVIYVRSIDSLFRLLCFVGVLRPTLIDISKVDLSLFNPEEKEFARELVSKYLGAIDRSVFKVRVLRKVLSWMRIETLLTIDNARDYWELILACRLNNIKTYAFQHGHFTKYHVGWLNDGTFTGQIAHPDKLFVWSDFWHEELRRLGTYFPDSSVEVGGFKNKVESSSPKSDRPYLGVLIPYEVDSSKLEVRKYIDTLLSCDDIRILFKLRTDIDIERQMKEYGLKEGYSPNLLFISDTAKHLPEVDVVAGTYSTFLYDMVAHERPVVIFKTSSDFGEGLSVNGLAETVDMDGICQKIKEAASTDPGILISRKAKLFGERPGLMYDTVRTLCSRK